MLRLPPTRIELKHEDRGELLNQAKERAQQVAAAAFQQQTTTTTPDGTQVDQRALQAQQVRSRLGIQ